MKNTIELIKRHTQELDEYMKKMVSIVFIGFQTVLYTTKLQYLTTYQELSMHV